MRLNQIRRHVSQAQPAQRRIEHLGSPVEHELAFDPHSELPAVFCELPGGDRCAKYNGAATTAMRRL